MRQHSLLKLVITVAVIIAAFFVCVRPLASSIRQGLDLQGGTHVVLEAVDTEQAQVNDDAMNRVIAIMEKRVNALGLTEPIIQREGERRVIIELPSRILMRQSRPSARRRCSSSVMRRETPS